MAGTEMNGAGRGVRQIRQILIGAALLMLSPAVFAGELSLLINGWAKHIDAAPGTNYNERNWGGGFQYDYERVDEYWVPFVTAAGFKDSERNMSYYAGGGVMRRFDVAASLANLYVDVGLVAFVMTRKTYKDNDPFLGALPAASIGTDYLAVNVTYVPKIHPKLVPLVFFQLKVPLAKF